MKQEVNLEHKIQPLIVCPLDHSVLYGAVLSHPAEQCEKANPVAFDTVSQKPSLEDPGCPDGGLQAWLVVLGVRLPIHMSLDGNRQCTRLLVLPSQREQLLVYSIPFIAHPGDPSYRSGFVVSWGVSRSYLVQRIQVVGSDQSTSYSIGISRLLPERLAERYLTFYYVRPIYFHPL